MNCSECDKQKLIHYNESLKKAKETAEIYGRANGLKELVIVETINGIPGYRIPGDESLIRLRIVEYLFIVG